MDLAPASTDLHTVSFPPPDNDSDLGLSCWSKSYRHKQAYRAWLLMRSCGGVKTPVDNKFVWEHLLDAQIYAGTPGKPDLAMVDYFNLSPCDKRIANNKSPDYPTFLSHLTAIERKVLEQPQISRPQSLVLLTEAQCIFSHTQTQPVCQELPRFAFDNGDGKLVTSPLMGVLPDSHSLFNDFPYSENVPPEDLPWPARQEIYNLVRITQSDDSFSALSMKVVASLTGTRTLLLNKAGEMEFFLFVPADDIQPKDYGSDVSSAPWDDCQSDPNLCHDRVREIETHLIINDYMDVSGAAQTVAQDMDSYSGSSSGIDDDDNLATPIFTDDMDVAVTPQAVARDIDSDSGFSSGISDDNSKPFFGPDLDLAAYPVYSEKESRNTLQGGTLYGLHGYLPGFNPDACPVRKRSKPTCRTDVVKLVPVSRGDFKIFRIPNIYFYHRLYRKDLKSFSSGDDHVVEQHKDLEGSSSGKSRVVEQP